MALPSPYSLENGSAVYKVVNGGSQLGRSGVVMGVFVSASKKRHHFVMEEETLVEEQNSFKRTKSYYHITKIFKKNYVKIILYIILY